MDKLVVPTDVDADVIEEGSLPSCGLYINTSDNLSRKSPKRSFAVSHTSPFAPSSKRARSTSCPTPHSPSTPFSPSTSSLGYELFVRSRRSSSQSMVGSVEESVASLKTSPQTLPTSEQENSSGSPQSQAPVVCDLKSAAFFSISADDASIYYARDEEDHELAELAAASMESVPHAHGERSLHVDGMETKSAVPDEGCVQTSATPAFQQLCL